MNNTYTIMKMTLLTVIALTATLCVGTLRAEPVTPDAFGFRTKAIGILASLDLTADQKDKLREVVKAHRPQLEPLVRQLIDERRALRDQIRTVPADEVAIRAQSALVAQVEGNLAVERGRLFTDLRPLVTDEQAVKLVEIQSLVEQRMDAVLNKIGKRIESR